MSYISGSLRFTNPELDHRLSTDVGGPTPHGGSRVGTAGTRGHSSTFSRTFFLIIWEYGSRMHFSPEVTWLSNLPIRSGETKFEKTAENKCESERRLDIG
jgi:hypothetical protein